MPPLYATLRGRLVRRAFSTRSARHSLAETTEANMVRTKQVNIRVSAEEYAALMAEAEKAGMQVAAFVRDAALRKRIKAAPPAINADAWITLGKTLFQSTPPRGGRLHVTYQADIPLIPCINARTPPVIHAFLASKADCSSLFNVFNP